MRDILLALLPHTVGSIPVAVQRTETNVVVPLSKRSSVVGVLLKLFLPFFFFFSFAGALGLLPNDAIVRVVWSREPDLSSGRFTSAVSSRTTSFNTPASDARIADTTAAITAAAAAATSAATNGTRAACSVSFAQTSAGAVATSNGMALSDDGSTLEGAQVCSSAPELGARPIDACRCLTLYIDVCRRHLLRV